MMETSYLWGWRLWLSQWCKLLPSKVAVIKRFSFDRLCFYNTNEATPKPQSWRIPVHLAAYSQKDVASDSVSQFRLCRKTKGDKVPSSLLPVCFQVQVPCHPVTVRWQHISFPSPWFPLGGKQEIHFWRREITFGGSSEWVWCDLQRSELENEFLELATVPRKS